MHSGTVQWFDDQTGTGSIALDDGSVLPVTRDQIDGGGSQSLRADDQVRFDLQEGSDGARVIAVYVR